MFQVKETLLVNLNISSLKINLVILNIIFKTKGSIFRDSGYLLLLVIADESRPNIRRRRILRFAQNLPRGWVRPGGGNRVPIHTFLKNCMEDPIHTSRYISMQY